MPGLHGGPRGRRPAGPYVAGPGRGRVHLGGRDQLRPGLSALPLKVGEQLSVRSALLDVNRPQAHRARRGLVRHHPRSTWFSATSRLATNGLPHPEIPPPRHPPPPPPPAATPPAAPSRHIRLRAPDASAGHPRHGLLLGRRRGRRAAHPALAPSAARYGHPPGPMCPALRRGQRRRLRGGGRHRRGVSATWCTTIRRCRASAADGRRARAGARGRCGSSARCPASARTMVRIGLPVGSRSARSGT